MDDILDFGRIILVVAGALSIAILVRVFASRIGLPTAALLLIVAAVASELSDRLAGLLTFEDVQRVATLALIAILFDGGMSIGLQQVPHRRRADHDPRRPRDVRDGPARRRRGALPARLRLDRRRS